MLVLPASAAAAAAAATTTAFPCCKGELSAATPLGQLRGKRALLFQVKGGEKWRGGISFVREW